MLSNTADRGRAFRGTKHLALVPREMTRVRQQLSRLGGTHHSLMLVEQPTCDPARAVVTKTPKTGPG